FEELKVTFEEIIDAGDQVVVVAHHEGRGQVSGVEVDSRYYEVYTVREGKVSRIDEYANRAEALEAAGLSVPPTPPTNVEVVRREYEAMAARDWTAIAAIWHSEIELEASPYAPGAGTYRGHDEITQFYDTWAEPYSAYRVEAEEIIDAGNQVVAVERFAGKGLEGSRSEAWIEGHLFRVISFKDGKIWRIKEHRSRAEA